MNILTLQQYYFEILILQQQSIYNVLNGHCKVPAIFQKPFWQLHKYSCNIARFQWNIFEILPQYYGAMWAGSRKNTPKNKGSFFRQKKLSILKQL